MPAGSTEPRVLVVGLGNALMADDGAGLRVAERLRAGDLPPGCRVEPGGTDSLRIPSLWSGEREIWLVDALVLRAPPGTVHRLSHDEVLAVPQAHAGAHALSLPESLRWIAIASPGMTAVRFRLWGIEPERLDVGAALTPAVSRAVEAVALEISRELLAAASGR